MTETIAVIDFETTGLSPAQGARATEIAAVLVQDGEIVGRFQSLMNSGAWVPPFIEQLTGISNRMLQGAPPARAVMREVLQFTKGCPLVAHNAAFDRGFWQSEATWADAEPDPAHQFACTLLLARRLYPGAANHRLGTLAALHALPATGRAHRALADAETTAHLLLRMQRDVQDRFATSLHGQAVTHALLATLQRAGRGGLERCVSRHQGAGDVVREAVAAPTPFGGKRMFSGELQEIVSEKA
jgi:DNA polymerase III subunit epsilon